MRIKLAVFLIAFAGYTSGFAQERKVYVWYNGDQDKPILPILLAVNKKTLETDTIAFYKYLIDQSEYLNIRQFLSSDTVTFDPNFKWQNFDSVDFTIIEQGSYMVFFTKKIRSLERRVSKVLEILKSNPNYLIIKDRLETLTSRVEGKGTLSN